MIFDTVLASRALAVAFVAGAIGILSLGGMWYAIHLVDRLRTAEDRAERLAEEHRDGKEGE